MKVRVHTITCGQCGSLLILEIQEADDEEVEVADVGPCRPAFTQTWCRLHPLAPMLFNVRIRDTPEREGA